MSKVLSTRRSFLKGGTLAVVAGATSASLLAESNSKKNKGKNNFQIYDFIIVGGGPGGGPLAANLARNGYRVCLFEAGLDPKDETTNILDPSTAPVYSIPGQFAAAGEHPLIGWDFYVNTYDDKSKMEKNDKYVQQEKGIWYPRGSCLGGSAATNAMLWVYPHDSDWDEIAGQTGDSSWSSSKMRKLFERLEDCQYLEHGTPGHGFDGYISTSQFDNRVYNISPELREIAFAGTEIPNEISDLDINQLGVAAGETGTYLMTTHIDKSGPRPVRSTVRDYLIETAEKFPENLTIRTGCLVTKVIFNKKRRAIGVEYINKIGAYKASKVYSQGEEDTSAVFCKNEVILSAGTFNTPQLLQLSGVGEKQHLESFGIEVVCDLPGVGKNLQDRYEIHVSAKLKNDLNLLKSCQPGQATDPCAAAYMSGEWNNGEYNDFHGPYSTNLIYSACRIEKSSIADAPDILNFGVAYPFTGWYPGHSLKWSTNTWTWMVLKGHNKNTAGDVKIQTSDPTDRPSISFRYFEEGNDFHGDDLQGTLEALKLCRSYLQHPDAKKYIERELEPGEHVTTDSQLIDYIKNQSWGHHAACTCKIGSKDDPLAVLDSKFRVRGVNALRVVDASAFPKLPGFFPVASVHMLSEKASDSLLNQHKSTNKNLLADIKSYLLSQY